MCIRLPPNEAMSMSKCSNGPNNEDQAPYVLATKKRPVNHVRNFLTQRDLSCI